MAKKDIKTLLEEAGRRLESRLEADLLMAHAFDRSRGWLYAHGELEPDSAATRRFELLVERRLAGQPIAYLTGSREFFGRSFSVSEAVLIPRPETEHLVETALSLPLPEHAAVIDIGTGSGCIALSLALERLQWQLTATDISEAALGVAATNARRLGAGSVALHAGSLYEPVSGRKFDLIVSNPPYVAPGNSHLERGDLRFEPNQALEAPGKGLGIIDELIAGAPDHLEAGGWLVLEHGHDQGDMVRRMMMQTGFDEVRPVHDLAGIERVAVGRWPR